jgi:hypothetical protein
LKLASSICTNNVNHQSKFYLDHVITYSDNSESHLHHVRQVSDRVRQSALTVNLERFCLQRWRVLYPSKVKKHTRLGMCKTH